MISNSIVYDQQSVVPVCTIHPSMHPSSEVTTAASSASRYCVLLCGVIDHYNYNPVVLACDFRSSSSEHKFGAKKPSSDERRVASAG
jgi:hypothetical protein